MGFKDHFSNHAESYAESRPEYPDDLIAAISALCNDHDLAWDCATGNGQAAQSLARYFDQVIATDASEGQLSQAIAVDNVEYSCCTAESPQLEAASVDLVVVAQALHWFDLEQFFSGVDRVLKTAGVFATWSYGLTEISPELDEVIWRLYEDILGDYWPRERKLVEAAYKDINFPFSEITLPPFRMSLHWSFEQLLAYLMSWSAVRRYIQSNNRNPIDLVNNDLSRAWGDEAVREIHWPMTVIARRK